MRFLKSTFLWQFAAGFALGALGMVTLAPSEAVARQIAPEQHLAR